MYNNNYPDIESSGVVIYNSYYDYYKNGTLAIKEIGEYNHLVNTSPAGGLYFSSALAIVANTELNKYGVQLVKATGDLADLVNAILQMFQTYFVSHISVDNSELFTQFEGALEKMKNGTCNENNLSAEECSGVANLVEMYGNIDDATAALEILGQLPVNNNVVVNNNVKQIFDFELAYTAGDELTIGNYAFNSTPLTSITINGINNRFNNSWSSIGFPNELKPAD